MAPWFVGAVLLANPFWLAADWLLYPEFFHRMVFPRALISATSLIGVAMLFVRRPDAAWIFTLFGAQTGAALVVATAGGATDPYITGLFFTFVAGAMMFPLRATLHGVSHLLAVGSFGWACWTLHPNQGVAIAQQVFVSMWVSIFTVAGLYLVRRQKRSELATSLELESANRRLHETNTALTEARTEAERLSRAKSDFLASMSHELRTPLNAVIGYAELLRDEAIDRQPAWIEDLDRIRDAGRYLLRLVNDVLDLSKVAAGCRSPRRPWL